MTIRVNFFQNNPLTRSVLLGSSLVVVSIILWNTYLFFQIFKQEERLKMELFSKAYSSLDKAEMLNEDLDLPLSIIQSNYRLPLFLTDENDNIIDFNNISNEIETDSVKLRNFFLKIKNDNQPIKFEISDNEIRYLYYGNSDLLKKLKFYPLALFLIIVLFVLVIYSYYNSTQMAIQNKLWAGMAKETAHQIGTPLSSLIGWLEILKLENINPEAIQEIEKDINRLQTITNRFSKIGSEPKLEKENIVAITKETIDYLQPRLSKQMTLKTNFPEHDVEVMVNAVLHSWTMENLYKNAVDAMRGAGHLEVTMIVLDKVVQVFVTDTGKGIEKKNYKKIFDPGYTTKKRGWGLGLSLIKRIVETYHKGTVKVIHSEINKGTTMLLELPIYTD